MRFGWVQKLEKLSLVYFHSNLSEDMTQVFDRVGEEVELVYDKRNTRPSQRLKDCVDVLDVIFDGRWENDDVIDVN